MYHGYVKVNIVKRISEILNTIINHDTIIMEDLSFNQILRKEFTCGGVFNLEIMKKITQHENLFIF